MYIQVNLIDIPYIEKSTEILFTQNSLIMDVVVGEVSKHLWEAFLLIYLLSSFLLGNKAAVRHCHLSLF